MKKILLIALEKTRILFQAVVGDEKKIVDRYCNQWITVASRERISEAERESVGQAGFVCS